MRLHVVSLPHTQVAREYAACAYTQKVRKFIPMMEAEGFEVQLHQPITVEEQALFGFYGPQDYLRIDFDRNVRYWELSNERTIAALLEEDPKDIVCLIGGDPQQPIVDAVPQKCVEFGIGYKGVCRGTYKIFESHAWRNYVYGRNDMDGQYYDDVIPNYYEVDEFPVITKPDDYFAFVGRLNANKGLPVAQQVCEELGVELRIAGIGEPQGYGTFLGMVPGDEAIKLMAHAKGLFIATQYIPPFEGVHVEAQLCGTPVITSDFGVFTETVTNGVNGYRCKMYREYKTAARLINQLDRKAIAQEARETYSTSTVGAMYHRYFNRLQTLDGKGWYS